MRGVRGRGSGASLLALQRSAGNRATAALAQQAVQRVGPPGTVETDVEGGAEKLLGAGDFAGGQVGQFGGAGQFQGVDVNLQGGVTKPFDLRYFTRRRSAIRVSGAS